jgi:hypothetical protein
MRRRTGNSSDEMKTLVWLDECASQELVADRMTRHLELVVFVLETLISSL